MDASGIAVSVVSSVVASGLGSWAFVKWTADAARDRWLAGVKADYDAQLERLKNTLEVEQKRLQVRLDQATFVSKAQFDSEFAAMQTVYKLATELLIGFAALRDINVLKPVQPERVDANLGEKWDATSKSLNAFSAAIESLRPFYPAALYEELRECRRIVVPQIQKVWTYRDQTDNPSYVAAASQAVAEFEQHYGNAATVIRDRLASLSVAPG